jgi:hypothetical protein
VARVNITKQKRLLTAGETSRSRATRGTGSVGSGRYIIE